MRFSQRIGKTTIKSSLQIDSMDDDLRNRLWNNLTENLIEMVPNFYPSYSYRLELLKSIWRDFFILPMEDVPIHAGHYLHFISYLREWYFEAQWLEVYDLVDFLLQFDELCKKSFSTGCNRALIKEVAGYRVVNGQLIQMTSEQEIQAIETALEAPDAFKSVHIHLARALDLLAERKTPDYRNSIKESISAVEALCIIITKDDKATLGKALAIIEKEFALHSSLKEAYSKIYGYTSDADGIRHAILEDDVPVEFEDAKFMLVSCSAFINYLNAKIKL